MKKGEGDMADENDTDTGINTNTFYGNPTDGTATRDVIADAEETNQAARMAILGNSLRNLNQRNQAEAQDTRNITGMSGIQGQLNPRDPEQEQVATAQQAAKDAVVEATAPKQRDVTAPGTDFAAMQNLSDAQQRAAARYNANAKKVGGGADLSSRGTVVSPAEPGSASERATAGENARRLGGLSVVGRPSARQAVASPAAQGGVAGAGGAVASEAGETDTGGAAGGVDQGNLRVTRETTGPKGTTVTRTLTPTQDRGRQLNAILNKTPEQYREFAGLMVQDYQERVKALEGKPLEMKSLLEYMVARKAPHAQKDVLDTQRDIAEDAQRKLAAIAPEVQKLTAQSQSAVSGAQEAQVKAQAAVPEALAKLSKPAPHETDGGMRAITSAEQWLTANKDAFIANKTLTQEQFDQYHSELLNRLTDAQTEHHKAEAEKQRVGVEKELETTIKDKGSKNLDVGFVEGEMSNAYAQKAEYLERAIKDTAQKADGSVVSTLTAPAKDRLTMELRVAQAQQQKWHERQDKEVMMEGGVRGFMGAVGRQYLSGKRLSVGDMQKAITAMTVGALKAGMTPDYKKASEAYNKSVENTAKYDYMMDDRGKHPDKYQYDPTTGTITDVSDPKHPVVVSKPNEQAENALYEKMREMLDRLTVGSVDKAFAATEPQPAQQQ